MVVITLAGPPDRFCERAERMLQRVIDEHLIDCSLLRVSDFEAIIELGVFAVPGVLINGELKSVGRVPEAEEIIDWLGQIKE